MLAAYANSKRDVRIRLFDSFASSRLNKSMHDKGYENESPKSTHDNGYESWLVVFAATELWAS
jgi:hypothetical protein